MKNQGVKVLGFNNDIKIISRMSDSIDWNDIIQIAQMVIVMDRIKTAIMKYKLIQFEDVFSKLKINMNNLVVKNFESKETLIFKVEMNIKHLLKIYRENGTKAIPSTNNI